MARILIILLVAISAALFFFGGSPPVEVQVTRSDFPPRQQLREAAWQQDQWLFVYAAKDPAQLERYQRILAEFEKNPPRRRTFEVRSLTDTPDSLLGKYPTLLVGTGWPAHWLEQLSGLPGIDLQPNMFSLGKESFGAPSDLLKTMFLPNPWQPDLPLHLITGNSDEALLALLEDENEQDWSSLFWSGWGYELRQQQQIRYLGFFNDTSWVMDRETHYEFEPQAQLALESPHARFWTYDDTRIAADQARLMEQFGQQYEVIRSFTQGEDVPQLQWYFYPTVERKALRTTKMEQAHSDPKSLTVHLIHNAYFRGEEWGEQYRPLLRHWVGQPTTHALEEGLLLQWGENIRGRSWQEWASDLIASNSIFPLDQLFDNEALRREASLLTRFTAALWVDFLLQEWGQEQFLDQYLSWEGNASELSHLWPLWQQYLQQFQIAEKKTSTAYHGPFLKGFTLAHEGYRIFNGYGSANARQSIATLSALGNEAIAIVPYSYMRNPERPTPIPVATGAGGENDEAVLFSHFSAQDLGGFTLLKPQIWIGSGWPGDINFTTDEDWQAFFDYYGNWIKHYAFLAELYGFDALCIGTEMKQTTLKRPNEWRQLIREIRSIYRGTLTYAANWGEECEKLAFWSDLDFIGINCYYPLSKSDNPTDEELQNGVDRIMAKLERTHQKADRPVWFTEIGYRSAQHPWKSPHAEAEQRPVDENGQARCYEIMLGAVQQNEWIKGLFWWKWSAYLPHNEDWGRGYMPYDKAAEAVLARYYSNWEGQ